MVVDAKIEFDTDTKTIALFIRDRVEEYISPHQSMSGEPVDQDGS